MDGRQVQQGTGRARGRSRGGASAGPPGAGGPAPGAQGPPSSGYRGPPPGAGGPPPGAQGPPSSGYRGPPLSGPPVDPGAGVARGPISQAEGDQRTSGRGRADRRGGLSQAEELGQKPGPESMVGMEPLYQRAEGMAGPAAAAAAAGGQGRAVHRGPGAVRPGADSHAVAAQMETLYVGGARGEGLAGRRRGALSIQYLEPNYRPQNLGDKKGQSGNPRQVFSNVFRISEASDVATVYQYHVDFSPEVPSQRIRKSMINSLKALIGDVSITDGMLLFLPRRLDNEVTETVVTRQTDGTPVKVTIKYSNAVERGTNTVLQIFNLLYKRMLQHIGLTMIQRNYFNPKRSLDIPQHRLTIWPGYTSAIGLYESSIGLVVDVSHKIMSTQTVYDVIKDVSRNPQLRNPEAFKNAVVSAVVGKIVLTRYNNKTYRIDDVDFERHPTDTFEKRDKTSQSFVEYYKNAYQATIHDMNQPLLISFPSKKDQRAGQQGPICLVPELCVVTGLPEEIRQDQRRMRDIAQHTRIGPGERVQQLRDLTNQINDNPAARKEFANWNIALARDVAAVDGRVLLKENVRMASNNPLPFDALKVDWSREMRKECLKDAHNLEPDSWIFICPGMLNQLAGQVVQMLQQVARPMGMEISQPRAVSIQDANAHSYLNGLKANINKNTKMVVILLRNQRKDVYDALKSYLCLENPVPSQCLVEKTVRDDKKRMSVMTKVAIQMNCKLGGEIWSLEIPLNNTMVIGIDTYHDSQKKHRSAVGMVASLNKTFTRYYTKCFLQSENEELGRELNAGMQACLRKYQDVNGGTLPERIFLYRDGVGDGMIPMVKSYEIEQLVKGFSSVAPNYKPRLSVIVVKKRMATRLFVKDDRGFGNPPPGTVVDDGITKPMWYDFYIVSQSVNQGTVAPTHYNVIHHDNDNLRPEHMQRLTYKLCHLYYNWPGTIRVPAPCQYAHKVAFLVGQSLHREPHSSLCDKLFYL